MDQTGINNSPSMIENDTNLANHFTEVYSSSSGYTNNLGSASGSKIDRNSDVLSPNLHILQANKNQFHQINETNDNNTVIQANQQNQINNPKPFSQDSGEHYSPQILFSHSLDQGEIQLKHIDSFQMSDADRSNFIFLQNSIEFNQTEGESKWAKDDIDASERKLFEEINDGRPNQTDRENFNLNNRIPSGERAQEKDNQVSERIINTQQKIPQRLDVKIDKKSESISQDKQIEDSEGGQGNSEVDSSPSQLSGADWNNTAFKLISMGRFQELGRFCLERNVLYSEIENEQGNNLIIKAVQNKDLAGVKQLILDARKQLQAMNMTNIQEDEYIRQWINKESKLCYTAAHFACFMGDIGILQTLLIEGADFMKISQKEGSTGMHIAAQNDAVSSMVFLLLQGMDINIKDLKDATPLHWASFQGLDQSVQFLISLGASVNERDSEGMTPLILGAISGNLKIVRYLLLAGADNSIKDLKGRTALNIVQDEPEHQNPDIEEMLKRGSGFQEYCHIRPALKRTKKNPSLVIYYFLLYLSQHFTFVFFNYILWEQWERNIILFILVGLGIVTKLFFLSSWLHNPGYIEKYVFPKKEQKYIELLKLLEKEEASKICSHCCIVKPKRSRHCDICERCVSVYDHHCPWINNCVGSANHGMFLCFLITIWLTIILLVILNAIYIWRNDYPNEEQQEPVYIDPFEMISNQYISEFLVAKIIASGVSLFFAIIFGIPLTFLLVVQISNFSLNLTTFERFSQASLMNQSSQSALFRNTESLISTNIHFDSSRNASGLVQLIQQPVRTSIYSNCINMCTKNKANPAFLGTI